VFSNATTLTSITVANGNENYSSLDGVLFNLGRTSLIQYPIGKSQTSYSIPAGVTSIGDGAFYGETSLTSITIPASVTSIGGYAFYGATSLTSITIPASVTSIGGYAFFSATALTSITFDGISTLTSIRPYTFYAATALTSITIPASVTSIGVSAFESPTSLTSITFDGISTLTSIGADAFYNVPALTSLTIPASVTSIGGNAFYNANSLTSITFDGISTLTSIGALAFSSATALTTITIPASVTSIGASAFHGATALTSVYFLGSAPAADQVGDNALSNIGPSPKAYVKNANLSSFIPLVDGKWNGLTVEIVDPPAAAYVVTYNYNSATGGNSTASGRFTTGDTPITLPTPTRTGYTFAGWYSDAGFTTQIGDAGADYSPTGTNLALNAYAKWTEVPVLPETPPSGNPPADNTPPVDLVAQAAAADLAARTIKVKSKFAGKALASRVGVKMVSPKAKVTFKISKASKKICTKSGSKLKTLKAGNCIVTFTVQEPKPKKGKKPKATKTVKTLIVQ
jgi:uncharacterized repeat protein (TIGR02543 family)